MKYLLVIFLIPFTGLFARPGSPGSHDELPSFGGRGRESADRPVDERKSPDLYQADVFKWRCGNTPAQKAKSHYILAMVEPGQSVFSPAKEGSLSAECALLEVDERGQVVGRAVGGHIANNKNSISISITTIFRMCPYWSSCSLNYII